MSDTKDRVLYVRVPADLGDRVDQRAGQVRLSTSEWVRSAIELALASEPREVTITKRV